MIHVQCYCGHSAFNVQYHEVRRADGTRIVYFRHHGDPADKWATVKYTVEDEQKANRWHLHQSDYRPAKKPKEPKKPKK